MLRDEVWPIISALDNIEDLIFMQDGVPLHFAIGRLRARDQTSSKCAFEKSG